jgi:hypothetical protein
MSKSCGANRGDDLSRNNLRITDGVLEVIQTQAGHVPGVMAKI